MLPKNHLAKKILLAPLGVLFLIGSLSTALRYAPPYNLLKPKKLVFHWKTDDRAYLNEFQGVLEHIPANASAGIYGNHDNFAFFQFNTYPRNYQHNRLHGEYMILFEGRTESPPPEELGIKLFDSPQYSIYKKAI